MSDALTSLSDALAGLATRVGHGTVSLFPRHRAQRTGFAWQPGIIISSEQGMPDGAEVPAILPRGTVTTATVLGRDPSTNVAVLRVPDLDAARPEAAEPSLGSLAIAFGAAEGGATVRLGCVHRVGPAWDSMANGQIDRLIHLDIRLERRDEGGPVLDAAGGLLGMSTFGPRRRVLVIPVATIARVVPQLMAEGRIVQGWLGLGLQPVGLPTNLQDAAGREAALMVVSLAAGGPAEQAGILPGDILLDVGGQAAPHPRAVARALSGEQVGKPIPLRILRAGSPVDLRATVGLRPAA